jgi:hypothetical protein
MPQQVINGVGRVRVRKPSSSQPSSYDTDAQAFITATALTDTTQKNAINDLVLDLKAAGVWTKMKALYPMVGGTATTHKFNLKDPRDLDAAYRLVFNGGGTHSSNGYQPNGTTGYANTYLTPSTTLSLNSTHLSFYSRTNSTGNYADIGCAGVGSSNTNYLQILPKWSDNIFYGSVNDVDFTANTVANSLGLFIASRTGANASKTYQNNTIITAKTGASVSLSDKVIVIGARNLVSGGITNFSNRETIFASIGDGLTDLESNLFYQIVEKYQYALGRNINATQPFYFNRNYSNETNAFIFNGNITDATQQSAVNTLVGDLKASGIWTKLKAIYPMVGGTATSHKFNLTNPVDTNAAYRLTFAGGWTHSATGALPNGTTAYADTNLSPSATLTAYNTHISYYSRTNLLETTNFEMGSYNGSGGNMFALISPRSTGIAYSIQYDQNTASNYALASSQTNSTGFWMSNRTSNVGTTHKLWRNGASIAAATTTGGSMLTNNIWIGAINNGGGPPVAYYSRKQCAFSSIGDGLTDLESQLFYQIVEKFQYTLGRNINTTQPFYYNNAYSNESNAFIYNGGITDATQISAVNTLVTTLKTAGVWTKMKDVYPMVV